MKAFDFANIIVCARYKTDLYIEYIMGGQIIKRVFPKSELTYFLSKVESGDFLDNIGKISVLPKDVVDVPYLNWSEHFSRVFQEYLNTILFEEWSCMFCGKDLSCRGFSCSLDIFPDKISTVLVWKDLNSDTYVLRGKGGKFTREYGLDAWEKVYFLVSGNQAVCFTDVKSFTDFKFKPILGGGKQVSSFKVDDYQYNIFTTKSDTFYLT